MNTTTGAKRYVIESKRFYGTLKLARGNRKQQPLTEDKASSVTLLRRLQLHEDRNLTEDVERRQRPITGFQRLFQNPVAVGDARWTDPLGILFQRAAEREAKPIDLKLIPYFASDNRAETEIPVWLPLG